MKYINVAINLPVKNLFKQFTYAVPPQQDGSRGFDLKEAPQ